VLYTVVADIATERDMGLECLLISKFNEVIRHRFVTDWHECGLA